MLESKQAKSGGRVRLAAAMRAAAPAVWDFDVASGGFLVTDRVLELYGLPPGSVLGFADFINATLLTDRHWSEGVAEGAANFGADAVRYRIRRADTGEVRWLKARIASQAGSERMRSYTGTIEDITEQTRATHALMESETRLRLAIEAGKMAVWEVDLEAGIVTNTPELNVLFGLPPDAKPTFQELRALYAPGEIERLAKEGATLEVVRARYAEGNLKPKQNAFAAEGEDRTQVQADLTIITPAGVTKRLLYRAQYAFSLEGRPLITGLLVDITDRKLAEERLALVASELQHRVKNSLGVVQALARQTLSSPDRTGSVKIFLDRLMALATATDIILASETGVADLADIVAGITQPYRLKDADPFHVSGPSARLSGKAATALSMVLHELCTNAVKYGALSVPQGRIRLHWELIGDGGMRLEWREENGPPIQSPPEQGFGGKLLSTLVPTDLAGRLELVFEPGGVVCRIRTGRVLVNESTPPQAR
jgi:two-component sensor histidine kinase